MKSRAGWMAKARWGVMVHYLPDWIAPGRLWTSESWNAQVEAFDVEGLARQMEEVGAGYALLSIGQNSGFYLAPNATYDRLTGARPSRCSRRDLVTDLASALAPRRIPLLVYLTAGPPSNHAAVGRALGWEGEDRPNREFQRRWEQVIADWSRRWGGKVSGWWFDGCSRPNTMYRSPRPPHFGSFAAAARAGNPGAAVAFSPGLYYPVFPLSPHEDFTAGLIYDFEREFVNARRVADGRVDGVQLHVLSFLGRTWGRGEPRFTAGQVGAYTRKVTDLGGAVTWDVPVEAGGRIAAPFLDLLRAAGGARPSP
ncbi:MAG TPA: hypothetical protein VMR21_04650 [Vicinamibacteria bacterium]|nr:hypothetical protein [Vicinamibacteria bacterium]